MNCQAQTFRPRAWSAPTRPDENWLQYFVPSPDLTSTVSIPNRWARDAIFPTLPWEERFTYQIHIPSPASGLFGVASVPLVWEVAEPLRGPHARAATTTAASRPGSFLRRRARMSSRLRRREHAYARKAAPFSALGGLACRKLLVRVVRAAHQRA